MCVFHYSCGFVTVVNVWRASLKATFQILFKVYKWSLCSYWCGVVNQWRRILSCNFNTNEFSLFPRSILSVLSIVLPFLDILTAALQRSSLPVREGLGRLHWKMWGWQLHLFIMWGTKAHLERQPELVFSLILAPTQRVRINRQGRFICGQDKNSRRARSIPQALDLTDMQNSMCMWY